MTASKRPTPEGAPSAVWSVPKSGYTGHLPGWQVTPGRSLAILADRGRRKALWENQLRESCTFSELTSKGGTFSPGPMCVISTHPVPGTWAPKCNTWGRLERN